MCSTGTMNTRFNMKSIKWLLVFPVVALTVIPLDKAQSKQDYCKYSERRILFFIDRTTEYDEKDRLLFADGIEQIFNSLDAGDEVILHTIEDEHTASQQSFRACYPGCPNSDLLGWVFGTCKSMEMRGDRARFQVALARVGRQMLGEQKEFPFSDVAATIAAVSNSYSSSSRSITNPLRVFRHDRKLAGPPLADRA